MKSQEKLTIQTSTDLFIFIEGVDQADHHARQHAHFSEQAKLAITALQAQYVDVQALSDNTPAKAGILPKEITRAVISRLWDSKLATLDQTGDMVQKQQNHLDHWYKVVKAGILYGMPHTQSIKILQEGLVKQHDVLVKKQAADKAKAEKAEKEAAAAKEKADKEAEKAAQAQATQDFDAMIEAAQAGKAAQAQAIEAQAQAIEAKELLESTEKALEKINAKIATAQKQADKKAAAKQPVKEASVATVQQSAPKPASVGNADNNQQDPKLDFMTMNFSKDCKEEATRMLAEIEADYKPSKPEMLMLAKLILDKYNN